MGGEGRSIPYKDVEHAAAPSRGCSDQASNNSGQVMDADVAAIYARAKTRARSAVDGVRHMGTRVSQPQINARRPNNGIGRNARMRGKDRTSGQGTEGEPQATGERWPGTSHSEDALKTTVPTCNPQREGGERPNYEDEGGPMRDHIMDQLAGPVSQRSGDQDSS